MIELSLWEIMLMCIALTMRERERKKTGLRESSCNAQTLALLSFRPGDCLVFISLSDYFDDVINSFNEHRETKKKKNLIMVITNR